MVEGCHCRGTLGQLLVRGVQGRVMQDDRWVLVFDRVGIALYTVAICLSLHYLYLYHRFEYVGLTRY